MVTRSACWGPVRPDPPASWALNKSTWIGLGNFWGQAESANSPQTLTSRMKGLFQKRSSSNPDLTAVARIECVKSEHPHCGSYNICICLDFNNGAEWLLRIPTNGYIGCFYTLASSALNSEAGTMKITQSRTTSIRTKTNMKDREVANLPRRLSLRFGFSNRGIEPQPLIGRKQNPSTTESAILVISASPLAMAPSTKIERGGCIVNS